jgi:oligopeptide transport system substrate-binding protein
MKTPKFVQRVFNTIGWLMILLMPMLIGFVGGKYSVFDPQTNGVSATDTIVIRAYDNADELQRDPQYFNINFYSDDISTQSFLYSGLVKIDHAGQVIPDLAEKWSVSKDYLTYTFTLRADAKFGNGKKVTSHDIAYTLRRAASLDALYVSQNAVMQILGYEKLKDGGDFSGIREINDQTIEITLTRPIQGFLYNLAMHVLYIVDSDNIAANKHWYQQPNATGPYKMVKYVAGRYALLQRKDDYYGEVPRIRYILFVYQNHATAALANTDNYAANLYDVIKLNYFQADEFQTQTSPFQSELRTFRPWCYSYFRLNNGDVFSDIHMRRAFNAAINRDAYVQLMYGGDATVTHSVFSPGMPGYSEHNDYAVFDLKFARNERLKATTEQKSISTNVYGFIDESSTEYEIIGQMIRRGWDAQDLDSVQLTIEPNIVTAFKDKYSDFTGHRYCRINPDPAYTMLNLFFSYNSSGRDYSPFYQSYQTAEVEPDADKRIALFQEIERQIMAEVPIAFTATPNDYYLMKSYVYGFNAIPGVALPLQDMNIDGKKFYLFTAMLKEQVQNVVKVISGFTN